MKVIEAENMILLFLNQEERGRLEIIVRDKCERCRKEFTVKKVGRSRFCSSTCSAYQRVVKMRKKNGAAK